MKFMHLGDLHIGKSVHDFSMIEDQRYILDQLLSIMDAQEVDGVLIAGDIYDRAVPSEEAVGVLDHFLCQLADRRIKTFIISGNHDSDERLSFGSSLFESSGIYIASRYEGALYRQIMQDEYGAVNIYLLPFVKASQVKHFFPKAAINSYDQAVRAVLAQAEIRKEERNILVAHQFVIGQGEEPRLGGSENAAVQTVGTIEMIGADCFDSFDYTALGHIHSPQRTGKDCIRYSGSPLKYSLSEVNNTKSVPIITLGKKGEVAVELIPLRPLRDMRHIKGRLEQLLEPEHIQSPEDYIYVTLTDEEPVSDAMAVIRQYYPNTMKLDYENSHTRAMEQVDLSRVTRERSFPELISDFYQMMYGCNMSEEEMKIMLEAAEEAGVVDEAG